MVTYLVTFAVIILLLYAAVRVHMFLGLNRPAKKDNLDEISRTPHLHEVLFSH